MSPVWRSFVLENATLQDLVFTNNSGSIVLDIDSYYTATDVSGIRVQHNRASGIRMLNTMPRYEGHPVVLKHVIVTDNIQGSAQVRNPVQQKVEVPADTCRSSSCSQL